MNIFEKSSDIYGNYSSEKMQQMTKNFLDAVKSVRNKLGSRAYKLDQYLNMIFEAASCTDSFDAMSDGSSFFSELRVLCRGILNYESENKEHPFYQTARSFIENHRFPYREKYTLLEIYCVLLIPQFTDYAVNEYTEKIKRKVNSAVDTVALSQYYDLIADLVGEEEMETLNNAIRERFIMISAVNSFLQSITDECLYCLTYRDPETSKQVFQLIQEENL